MTRRRGRPFRVDAVALARAGASALLAIDGRALGGMMTLALDQPTATWGPEGESSGVALVSIDGPLQQRAEDHICGWADGYDAIAARVMIALNDPKVDSLVLRINSPGGDLAGLEEGVRRMVEARDASGKQVFAFVDELAASAAYWIAAAVADGGVYLPTSGGVGSVGVIGGIVDQTRALEAEGIGVTLVRDPDGKAAGNPLGPVTDVAVERLTRDVRAASARFATAIADARDLSVEAVRATNADVFEGAAAVAAGFADGVSTLEAVLAMAAEAAKARKSGALPPAAAQAARAAAKATRLAAAEVDAELMRLARLELPGKSDEYVRGYAKARAPWLREAAAARTQTAFAASGGVQVIPIGPKLTAYELDLCRKKGIEPAAYAKTKTAIAGRTDPRAAGTLTPGVDATDWGLSARELAAAKAAGADPWRFAMALRGTQRRQLPVPAGMTIREAERCLQRNESPAAYLARRDKGRALMRGATNEGGKEA